MKVCTLFVVALIAFVFLAPANGQTRKSATTNGRRAKTEAAQIPKVPCTIPLANSPTLQRLKLDYAPNQLEYAFAGDPYFQRGNGNSSGNGFTYSYVFYARETPQPSFLERMTPEQNARLDNYLKQVKPADYAELKKAQKEAEEAQRNAPPKAPVVTPNQIVKRMTVSFYGRDIPRIYNYQIQYSDDFAFENEEEIKQNFAENLKIPVGSWVPIPDPNYSQQVIRSFVGLLDLRLVPVENLILRQADCNGWRAVFVTSENTTGLALSIINSTVSDNMDQLIANDVKATNDAQKQRTKKIFKP